MEPHQHFTLTFLLTSFIAAILQLEFWKAVKWVLVASASGVLYDVDHLIYGLIIGKVKLAGVLRNPKIIFRIRRRTGVLPADIPTHNIFIALLITLLSAIVVPQYAAPIGIGLTFHIICDSYIPRWLSEKK